MCQPPEPSLAWGGHLERPARGDRRSEFLSFLEQLVIDFPGETSLHSGALSQAITISRRETDGELILGEGAQGSSSSARGWLSSGREIKEMEGLAYLTLTLPSLSHRSMCQKYMGGTRRGCSHAPIVGLLPSPSLLHPPAP